VETPDLAEAIKRLSETLAPSPKKQPETAPKVMRPEIEAEMGKLRERILNLESRLAEAKARESSLEALIEEYRSRIKHLESRLPEAEAVEKVMRSYEERISHLEEKLKEREAENRELRGQLLEASEDLEKLEELKGLLLDWRDITLELAKRLDVELVPSDVQRIIEERDSYRQLYEELKEEIEKKRRLTENVLNDSTVQDWVKTAEATLRWFLDRRSEHGKILKKIVVTDPSYLFLPEEFPEADVSPATVATYLNEFTSRGLVLKHEKAKAGRTAYSNALPLWVSHNVRRIRLDATDEAIDKIIEDLKEFVLRGVERIAFLDDVRRKKR
jgi:predicted  nucleic acid-binding Zn-ribbon protein